ncbi:hypothetical protein C440_00160 [Haloferax mucosum ATCC BAA-1512]|uniref:Uncharacterized protein n=1 Tax=Haloferax mucosum ATCC BAA-1512 TaxID=662479 RepID=M0IRQ8_9EURY|nr:hypothetical protein C440_00160 [Haloferax mucosum ATCC BAA-1512]
MTTVDDFRYRKRRAVLCLVTALFSATVFVFYSNPLDVRGVVVSLVLGVWSVADVAWPRVSAWLDTATARVTGLFWVAVGAGIGISSVLASGVINKLGWGLFVGVAIAVYGLFVAVTQ